ncbi:hypothetical protein IJG91_00470 [Candidatus Saccharibacteria bacterium]|nr:hypothetical protein [Candidatus Saccharibacteria bacterium]
MIEILVFDLTLAAINIGNYIEKELPIEAKKVVGDNCHSVEEVAEKIAPYIGEVDVVILASSTLSAKCGEYLERRYPAQKFIFFGADLPKVIAENKKVSILTPLELRATQYYQMQKARCQGQEITELNCERWLEIVKSRNFHWQEMIIHEVEGLIGVKLIINSPELVAIYDELEKIIDWRVNLIDLRKGIVEELKKYFSMKDGHNMGRSIRETVLINNGLLK